MLEGLKRFFGAKSDYQKLSQDEIEDTVSIIHKIHQKSLQLVTTQQETYSTGLPKEKDAEAFVNAYTGLVWVNTAVRAIIEPAKDIPIKIYRVNNNLARYEEKEEVKRGLAYELLLEPNPFFSFCEWQEYQLGSLCLDGNNYSYIDKDKRELWPLRPPNVYVHASRSDFIDKYIYTDAMFGDVQDINPIEMIHGKNYNPGKDGYFYGLSPLESCWDAVNYQDKEARFNEIFWKEGARLQGAFIVKEQLDKEQAQQLYLSIKKNTKGVSNMLKDLILSGGMDYKQLGVAAKDQQIIERLQMSIEEILSAYRVPPGVVGLLQFSNYSNMEVQERLLWKNAIIPMLTRITEALNKNPLMSENGALYFEHDLSGISILQDNLKDKAELGKVLIESGQWTQNEVRTEIWDKPPSSDGDVLKPVIQNTNPLISLSSQVIDQKSLPAKKKDEQPLPINPHWTLSDESARLHAKAFDDELESNDNEFMKVMQGHFKDQNEQIQKNIRVLIRESGGSPKIEDFVKIVSGLGDEAERLKTALKDPMSKVLKKFGEREFKKLENKVKSLSRMTTKADGDDLRRRQSQLLQPEFDFSDPGLQKYLIERPYGVAGVVDQKTLEDLRIAIAEEIKRGGTYADISEVVSEYFGGIESYRAMRIARTETASAANYAIEKTYVQNSDVVWGKRWVTANDDLVRDSHIESGIQPSVNGEPITTLEDDFVLGSGVQTPRPQGSGEAGEDINCRCTISAVTRFDAYDRGLITLEEFESVFE